MKTGQIGARSSTFSLPRCAKNVKHCRITLDLSSNWAILGGVRPGGERSRRKRSEFVGQPNELGALLADLRKAKGLSLREVEEATGKAVSNPYLSQLENGKIKKPSPNVLHSLAEVYVVPYESLMEKAGYLLPSEDGGRRRRRLAAFAIDDLTAEEEEELLKYLAFLRTRSAS
jgi:HTH-type transcriptional regulator, competence development regulator